MIWVAVILDLVLFLLVISLVYRKGRRDQEKEMRSTDEYLEAKGRYRTAHRILLLLNTFPEGERTWWEPSSPFYFIAIHCRQEILDFEEKYQSLPKEER